MPHLLLSQDSEASTTVYTLATSYIILSSIYKFDNCVLKKLIISLILLYKFVLS